MMLMLMVLAQGISAVQENETTIRVTVPGTFETTITKTKGFGHTWFDLKHDPEKKRDLAPVFTEAGLLWTKLGIGDKDKDRVGTANPPKKIELLEAGPVRARVKLSGQMNRRGLGVPKEDLEELAFEQTFTIYPTGSVYLDYALVAKEDLALRHFLLILKPNGAWGKNGKVEGAGEVKCAGEHGPAKPSGATASSFALEWTDGPTHFQDMLMVMNKGRYNGTYWDEGYLDKDLRCGLDVLSRWPDKRLPAGTDHLLLMMVFRHDLNGSDAAKSVAEDYRTPAPEMGRFNEAEGCYELKASPGGTTFTLRGAAIPRHYPVFKISEWSGSAPKTLTMAGATLAADRDFRASVEGNVLLIQLLHVLRKDVQLSIPRP